MRRERASAFQRQYLNEFASSSSQFVDLSKWDRCVNPAIGHISADLFLQTFVGVDASFKHDSTAIVVVAFDQSRQQVRLVTHKVYQPTSDQPLDFELTVEAALVNIGRCYQVQKILFDPWQMQSVAQRLHKRGLPIEEFPQTSPNLTSPSQNLFDLIESLGLVMYPDEQLRLAISRAVAIETPRGWRIGICASPWRWPATPPCRRRGSHFLIGLGRLSMARQSVAATRTMTESWRAKPSKTPNGGSKNTMPTFYLAGVSGEDQCNGNRQPSPMNFGATPPPPSR